MLVRALGASAFGLRGGCGIPMVQEAGPLRRMFITRLHRVPTLRDPFDYLRIYL